MEIKISECFCAWMDLLGYGQAFYNSNWNLTDSTAIANLQRIKYLENDFTFIGNILYEKIFTLNDGVITNFDMTPGMHPNMLNTWFENIIRKFYTMDGKDRAVGNPGVRGVLTYGQRAQYTDKELLGQDEWVMTSPEKLKMYHENKVLFAPKELQMNTAFSKAYIIESGGSKKGVVKNELNITEEFLHKYVSLINQAGEIEVPGVEEVDQSGQRNLLYDSYFIQYSAEFDGENLVIKEALNGEEPKIVYRVRFKTLGQYINEEQALSQTLYAPISYSYWDGETLCDFFMEEIESMWRV